ncbi:hypothetical protein GV792_04590 [Nocardia cyriacigeorgica]|uniref:hypothetical protein n=1 Tax=Nocardia cyriacigeorgica TaxID=135487 RepID=UPI0013B9A80B|nr:hypothetical protein [Nocardia cyriacigeorgica]NEW49321.1 hypothetical protein [Nocardia cyriacigeorgica]
MSPEQIAAIGGIIAAVLGAWTAAQGKKVAELQGRIEKLEDELEAAHAIGRAAMKYIRKLWRWSDQRDVAHERGTQPPPQPELPELLKEEI